MGNVSSISVRQAVANEAAASGPVTGSVTLTGWGEAFFKITLSNYHNPRYLGNT